jgi:biopolymer transport protein ExbD
MSKKRSIKKPGIKIDMTPLVDVIMLLLTFFMLTATFRAESTEAIEVNLPQSANTDSTKMPSENVMILTLTKAGDVFLDVDNFKVRQSVFGDPFGIGMYHPDSLSKSELETTGKINGKVFKRKIVTMNKSQFEKSLNDLRLNLKNETNNKADFRIVVKGDKGTNYGVVEDLMSSLKDTKNTRFSLVTSYESENK